MKQEWLDVLAEILGEPITVLHQLGGGDFAQAFQIVAQSGARYFVKTHANPPSGFFTTESKGLDWLRDSANVNVPALVAVSDDPPFLCLDWVETDGASKLDQAQLLSGDRSFGRALAALHRQYLQSSVFDSVSTIENQHQEADSCCVQSELSRAEFRFGRPDGRTTGSLGLPNRPSKNWVEFYATQRLQPLQRIAADRKALPVSALDRLERVADRLSDVGGPPEGAALLHGDLWAGNRLVDKYGASWLIDPAAHGGHREFDLAMMRLFGGYSDDCFAAYQESHPLADGWQNRIELHQLAPLIVHSIKFGGSYVSATEKVLRKYS